MVAAFERGGEVVTVSPTRLAAVDTVYAMTVHKSQGSQFHTVAFLVPAGRLTPVDPGAPLHRRDPGPGAADPRRAAEEPIRAAIERPISRASGLRQALWGGEGLTRASANAAWHSLLGSASS